MAATPQPLEEVPLAPVYEILLSHEENPRDGTVSVITVSEGDELSLKCIGSSGMKEETLRLDKTLSDESTASVGLRVGNSIVYKIDSFKGAAHSGVYDCFAERKDTGAEHSRMMRIARKTNRSKTLDRVANYCHREDYFCHGQGNCYIDGKMKFCDCFDGFAGQRCEMMQVHSESIELIKYVGGASGVLSVASVFVLVLLAILLYKEKRRTKRLIKYVGSEHDLYSIYTEDPDILLHKCDDTCIERGEEPDNDLKEVMIKREARRPIKSYPPVRDVQSPMSSWNASRKGVS